MKTAFIFPGQGSQSVGMLRELFDDYIVARNVFHAADTALDMPLLNMIMYGPEESLQLTCNTQPALLASSIASAAVLRQHGIQADVVAGHSLGEYSALVYAGAVSFEDALIGVRYRGTFMQEAVPVGQGAMAAIIGADVSGVVDICTLITEKVDTVEAVNFNCPKQVVIAGKSEAVNAVIKEVKQQKIGKAVLLPVSAPFHSSLMEPAAERLKTVLKNTEFRDARIPLYSNVTAKPVTKAVTIKRMLVKQAASPVLWEQAVRNMIKNGVDTFVEVGPGHTLSNFVKKIDDSVQVLQAGDREGLQNTLKVLKGA